MPGLGSRFFKSPGARRRLRVLSIVGFSAVALLGWWTVAQEGPTPARLMGAVGSSVAVIVEAFIPRRRRLLRRWKGESVRSDGPPVL